MAIFGNFGVAATRGGSPATPFAIGLYLPQPAAATGGGTAASPQLAAQLQAGGAYDPTLPMQWQHPLAGNYGASPGAAGTGVALTWFEDIPQPHRVELRPGVSLGTALSGAPIVRSYDQLLWGYTRIKADAWYALVNLYRLLRRTGGATQGRLRVRWPDPESGGLVDASARWEPLPAYARSPVALEGVQLLFSHLGIDDDPLLPTQGYRTPAILVDQLPGARPNPWAGVFPTD